MNQTSSTPFAAPTQARLAALALSAVLTLGMLIGIQTLASTEGGSNQMAQASQSHA